MIELINKGWDANIIVYKSGKCADGYSKSKRLKLEILKDGKARLFEF